MATCRDIITRALQMATIIPLGVQPSAKESALGMEVLQSLYDGWVAVGMFGTLKDVYTAVDAAALENQRITHPGVTITIPETLGIDGQEGDERPVHDLALIEIFNTVTDVRTVQLWDRNAWVVLTGLVLDTDAPLSARGSIGLSAVLAQLLCGAFGVETNRSIETLARTFLTGIMWKRATSQTADTAEYF